ncbi:MAG TPA: hypothetical protein VIV15_01585, partial [Anaerolineales bacterium]
QAQVQVRGPDGSEQTLDMPASLQPSIAWTPKSPGVYGIDMVITGRAPDGKPIERTAFLTVEAQPSGNPKQATTNLSALIAGVVIALALAAFLFIWIIRRVFRRPH